MEIKDVDDVKVAVIGPRLDASTAGKAEDVIDDLIRNGAKKILCDFSRTEFISSAGLRLLLSISKKLKHRHGKCRLNSLLRGSAHK